MPCSQLAFGVNEGVVNPLYTKHCLSENKAGVQRGPFVTASDENSCCHLSFFLERTSIFVEFRIFIFPRNHCAEKKKDGIGASFCFKDHLKEGCGTCSFTMSPQRHSCSLTFQRLITVALSELSCLVPGLILITILRPCE